MYERKSLPVAPVLIYLNKQNKETLFAGMIQDLNNDFYDHISLNIWSRKIILVSPLYSDVYS